MADTRPMRGGSVRLYSLSAAVLLIGFGIIGAVIADNDRAFELLVGLIITTIPSIIAAAFAERSNRDIRNGVVTEKAKQGAQAAITELEVMTRTGPVATAQVAALANQTDALAILLNEIHSLTKENKEVLSEIKEGTGNDG